MLTWKLQQVVMPLKQQLVASGGQAELFGGLVTELQQKLVLQLLELTISILELARLELTMLEEVKSDEASWKNCRAG